ncbi:MAG: hypothetical protein LBO82_06155 [Synergistaceae bacterium]|nr:hypothetical protein [Synergistaceae bacterium]
MKKLAASRGYALCWTMLLIFTASALLALAAAHASYFSGVTDVFMRRARARSDLLSLTNLALAWLKSEIKAGAVPVADAVKSDGHLTDSENLCVFSLENPAGEIKIGKIKITGSVKVFDLGYDPEKAAVPPDGLLFFPPSLPGAYLVRATAAEQGLASMTAESVFILVSADVPGAGTVWILEEEALFSREIFR